MKRCFRVFAVLMIALITIFAATALAQLDTGTVTVAVKDASGSSVPGANVVLRNENTGIEVRSGTTNDQGNFNAALIPSGLVGERTSTISALKEGSVSDLGMA